MKLNKLKALVSATVCCAFIGVSLIGCGNNDTKQEPGNGGKGLSAAEKKAKKGDE